jgi:hypothetical protein
MATVPPGPASAFMSTVTNISDTAIGRPFFEVTELTRSNHDGAVLRLATRNRVAADRDGRRGAAQLP